MTSVYLKNLVRFLCVVIYTFNTRQRLWHANQEKDISWEVFLMQTHKSFVYAWSVMTVSLRIKQMAAWGT